MCSLDNRSFASKLEAAVYQILKLRQSAKELKIIAFQEKTYLTEARIGYIPDFTCQDAITGDIFYVEAKGFESETWPIKKKLWKFYGCGKLEIWKGSYKKPYLDEIIDPANR